MSEPLNLPQLQSRLAEIQTALRSANGSDTRRWLEDRIKETNTAINELIARQRRAEEEEQDRKDSEACKAATEEIWNPVRARLVQGPLDLKIREAVRQKHLSAAAHAEEEMGKSKGLLTETGAQLPKVWKAKRDAYKAVAQRLEIFTYDLNHEPLTLPENYYGNGFSISAENFNFRTLAEKALLVYATRRYFFQTGRHAETQYLPNLPEPIRIPDYPSMGLKAIMEMEAQRYLSTPDFEELEVIYKVATSTLEQPNSPNLLLWPTGKPVNLSTECFWDFGKRCYRRYPDAVAIESGDFIEHVQDAAGNWVPQYAPATLAAPRSIRLLQGDHKPPIETGRVFFRFGSWWTKEQVLEAESAPL
jgi:hypothetical protein